MDNPEEQFEAAQRDRLLNRAAQLKTDLVMVERKHDALARFMAEVRSQGDLASWLSNQAYPGAELGLCMSDDGEIWFRNAGE